MLRERSLLLYYWTKLNSHLSFGKTSCVCCVTAGSLAITQGVPAEGTPFIPGTASAGCGCSIPDPTRPDLPYQKGPLSDPASASSARACNSQSDGCDRELPFLAPALGRPWPTRPPPLALLIGGPISSLRHGQAPLLYVRIHFGLF